MALHRRHDGTLKTNNDTGFGSSNNVGGRFINKDGSFNLRKTGVPFLERFSIYHTMLTIPRWKFSAVIVLFFLSANLFYTCLYLLIGVNEFQGMIAQTDWEKFKEVFFFSTQTYTTVGYGRVNPIGDGASFVAAIEAMNGLLSFAVFTGLIYGRFSKPRANLAFSEHALVSPYQDKTALMFRFVSQKENHNLTDVSVRVTIGLQELENEKHVYKFYTLDLERERADNLPMNFTVVHPIDEKSPLYGLGFEEMKTADVEIYVLIRAFDDVYSNNVLQRTSYTYEEIKFNVKFVPMYHESEDKNTTILDLDKLNEYREIESLSE
jgi:inward rectifier potassium channel